MRHRPMHFALLITLSLSACSSTSESLSEPTVTHTLARTEEGSLAQQETETIEAHARVTDIDYSTRQVALERADGTKVTLRAGPAVTRFNEIKKGDTVTVQYFESLAFEVHKPSEIELASGPEVAVGVAKNNPELPPGAGVGAITSTIVTVKSVDLEKKLATVVLPDGEGVTVKARHPENLLRMQPGDKIAITYSNAMAVAIDPA